MKVSIEYCVVWDYLPKAASLAETIKNKIPDTDVELIKSSGGAFEIRRNNSMIFSKLGKGRFPEHDEIIELLK